MIFIPTTIRDVAKAAGVSITTVSRALNGYSDVRSETRKRVVRIAEELHYRPSAVARSLVRNRTQTVGLLVSDLAQSPSGHHFMFEVLRGVHDRLAELGYELILVSTSTARQRLVSYLDMCTERRFDGVIVMGIRLDDPYVREVVEAPLPSVCVDVPLLSDHCGYVMTDNFHGAHSAMKHLLSKGHRKIGFVNGYSQAAVSRERLRGYQDTLQAEGMEWDPSLVYEGDFTTKGGELGTKELLQRHPDITGLFFASDLMAIGGLRYAASKPVRVPEDLAIVGFDDIELAEFVTPGLTTIRQRRYEMGQTAVEMLIGMLLRNEQPAGRVLAPELIIRQST